MNVLIVGCGKIGSRLAYLLYKVGHDVAVIDKRVENFNMLDDDFHGFTVQGVPIDQTILRKAGIEGCDALVAVTENDNTNVMVCQIARELFHVPVVLARIYDPRRESVFQQFHIKTICSTDLTVSSIYSMLTDSDKAKHVHFDNEILSFYTTKVSRHEIGHPVSSVVIKNQHYEEALFSVLHDDGSLSLAANAQSYVLLETDRLIIARIVK